MPNSFLTFFHAVAHYSSVDILLRVMKCLENWRQGTELPPPTGSSLLNYQDSLIRFNNQYDSLRDEMIEDDSVPPSIEIPAAAAGGTSGKTMKKNQSIRTDIQLLFICALIGPTVHRFEKVQFEGSTGHFLVILVELLAMVTDTMEAAAQPGLSTIEEAIDFIHHVRANIPKDQDSSTRLAAVLKGMRPWLQGRLGNII